MTIIRAANYLHVGPRLCTYRYDCRACGAGDLVSVLDLGKQPLANAFLRDDQLDTPEYRFPLHLMRCPACGLCQLNTVVEPGLLYGPHYAYRSGASDTWREHCEALADEIGPNKVVLDIGCLDGVLVRALAVIGSGASGCDPSAAPAPWTVRQLFGRETRIGPFDVIVAQNVFGHVDDARGFLEGVKANLAPDGVCIIECPWVADLIRCGRWDTIYHEHVSVWGLHSMMGVLRESGLCLRQVTHFPDLHGGTMRYYLQASRGDVSPWLGGAIFHMLAEVGLDYEKFRHDAEAQIDSWNSYFTNVQGKSIAAYGASAKLNTFLNALSPRPPIVGIFDDSPAKQNLYTPGWHYPVLVPTKMTMREVDVLLIGSPNIRSELEAKARSLGFSGEVKSLWTA